MQFKRCRLQDVASGSCLPIFLFLRFETTRELMSTSSIPCRAVNTGCQSKMAACLLCWFLLTAFTQVAGLPELGVWNVVYNQNTQIHGFSKSVFNGTKISVTINCKIKEKMRFDATWTVRYSPCAQEYDGIADDPDRLKGQLSWPTMLFFSDLNYKTVDYILSTTAIECGGDGSHVVHLYDESQKKYVTDKTLTVKQFLNDSNAGESAAVRALNAKTATKPETTTAAKTPETATKPETSTAAKTPHEIDHTVLTKFWRDGYFVFILKLKPRQAKNFTAAVDVRMPGPPGVGYISAVEYPLEIFYGVMGLVYLVYGVVWLVLLRCNWRDLMRVHFWIEGVIFLGMLEKAVFFAEYESIAKSGQSVRGAIIIAELVSSMKRAFARMLFIVVSLGFGVVKPRLGKTFWKVLCVGVLYFVLGSIWKCLRVLKSKSDQSDELMLASVSLAVLDLVIYWRIVSSVVQTKRRLRLLSNNAKLSLYRRFTYTLIFGFLASIAFMIWSITQHKLNACIADWRGLWVYGAFWHLLFSVLLLIIMILWRPTAHNLRYAFSPLIDAAEDDIDVALVINGGFDGDSPLKQRETKKSVKDELNSAAGNIPSSISDKPDLETTLHGMLNWTLKYQDDHNRHSRPLAGHEMSTEIKSTAQSAGLR